jgi:hypothetical protein
MLSIIGKPFKEKCVNAENWIDSAQDKAGLRLIERRCGNEPPEPIRYGVS